ncbi:hypothetical protein NECAME_19014 [Necator americanus]|uniref:Uncharacterized protein n=1 Tax=Necator americanus TaxID=51031 RepID=W2STV7_NECAM|nr:hypothetical protein NECAME_19014 [Necator americanus]ETN72137.1 hypothetical protein NECAME_19014 [Necator americanus]
MENENDRSGRDYSFWKMLESKAFRKGYRSVDTLEKPARVWEELDEVPYLRATVHEFLLFSIPVL